MNLFSIFSFITSKRAFSNTEADTSLSITSFCCNRQNLSSLLLCLTPALLPTRLSSQALSALTALRLHTLMILPALLFLLTLSSFLVQSATADTYELDNKKRISITIASHGVNRIAIDRDRILKLIGNESEYSVEGDAKMGCIFLVSKVAPKESFAITLISEKGVIQDIAFKASDKLDPVSVTLRSKPNSKSHPENVILTPNLDIKGAEMHSTLSAHSRPENVILRSKAQLESSALLSIEDILTNKLQGYNTTAISADDTDKSRSLCKLFGNDLCVKAAKVLEHSNKHFKITNITYLAHTIHSLNSKASPSYDGACSVWLSMLISKGELLKEYFPGLLAVTTFKNHLLIVEAL